MRPYDQRVINLLLDRYERSLLAAGENKRTIQIEVPFDRKTIPSYFDESSGEFERIHILMEQLEKEGLITIVWKDEKKGYLICKIRLEINALERAYRYVKRTPKRDMEDRLKNLIRGMLPETEDKADVFRQFCHSLLERLNSHQTVKEYLDLENPEDAGRLLRAVRLAEENQESCYIREFSIRHFQDSKVFETLEPRVVKVFRRFKREYADMDAAEILAEYNIYRTPDYVYFKGQVILLIENSEMNISSLRQGIGVSGEDLSRVRFSNLSHINKVITIENLTTFFRWQEEDALIIYLGGYHNEIRRRLLQMIYREIPQADYLHFGDIDAGGFAIFKDLIRKSGIPFQSYHMDLDTLKQYEQYGRRLTASDRARLEKMLDEDAWKDVIRYMLAHDVKLEQECILASEDDT